MDKKDEMIDLIKDEEKLRQLTLHSLKELGEIAEALIRKNRHDHWKK